MERFIAFLSNPGHSKISLSNLESRQRTTTYKTILAKRTMLLTFSARLKPRIGGGQSVFDSMTYDDLIMAFFPCIYFTGSVNPCYFRLDNMNYKSLTTKEKFDCIIERSDKRNEFYKLLYKLCAVCIQKEIRLIIENPFSELHYLHNNFLQEPSVIDKDRTRRGDFFKKPTGYWFIGCEPMVGNFTFQAPKKKLTVWKSKSASHAGLCSEERSMISPDYARNFICDFVLGKEQIGTQLTIFE